MRNISFALTTEQIRNQTKTVTRRLGWTFLKPGELLQPIVKGQGIEKGGRVERIGAPIRVISVRQESLWLMKSPVYGQAEVMAEGFETLSGEDFIDMFCRSHRACLPSARITRIAFAYTEPPR